MRLTQAQPRWTARRQALLPQPPIRPKAVAQLWPENCMRCHNMRSPESYSDAQWEVAMHYMRLRTDLTAQDADVAAQTDGALFWKTTEGRKPMPSFEKLISEDER
jgi:hypothetical protein